MGQGLIRQRRQLFEHQGEVFVVDGLAGFAEQLDRGVAVLIAEGSR